MGMIGPRQASETQKCGPALCSTLLGKRPRYRPLGNLASARAHFLADPQAARAILGCRLLKNVFRSSEPRSSSGIQSSRKPETGLAFRGKTTRAHQIFRGFVSSGRLNCGKRSAQQKPSRGSQATQEPTQGPGGRSVSTSSLSWEISWATVGEFVYGRI